MEIDFIDSGIITKYPKELLENRGIIEGNVTGVLWKNPYLLDIYDDLKAENFITYDGRLYFTLIETMKKEGYTVIDEISIVSFMNDKPQLKAVFEKRGGYRAIDSFASLLKETNMPKYYDDLMKANVLMDLHDKGFNVLLELEKFKKMSANDVYNYYDLILNNIFIKRTLELETEDLTTGYDDFIKRANSGENMGISYAKASPIMNYQTAGVRKGCTIVASTTSGGKSSFLAHHYILNFIEQGHRIVLIINEEDSDAWRSLLLTTVINTRIRQWDETTHSFTKGMSRKRFLQGNFTDEEMDLINKAIAWLAQYPKSIEYVKCFDYKIETVKKIVGKYSKLGYDVVMLDTFKAPDGGDTNNPAWKQMVEGSKALFQATAKEGMYLIITAQVALRYSSVRKLTCEHLGGATAISEIADTVIIFRDLFTDEVDEEDKKYVKPYKHLKGEDGKYTSSTTPIYLNPMEKYAVAFLAKVRAGEKGTEILYKKDMAYNVWHELGFCTVAQF